MQELVFARKVFLICGRSRVPFRTVLTISHFVNSRGLMNSETSDFVITRLISWAFGASFKQQMKVAGTVSEEYQQLQQQLIATAYALTNRWPPEMILRNARSQECSDPKDKVYALFKMLAYTSVKVAEPDYAKSIAEIYADAVNAVISQQCTLQILLQAPSPNKRPDLPSWVPDWSDASAVKDGFHEYLMEEKHHFQASKNSSSTRTGAEFELTRDTRFLHVRGIFQSIIIGNFPRQPVPPGFPSLAREDVTAEQLREELDLLRSHGSFVRALRHWALMAVRHPANPTAELVRAAAYQILLWCHRKEGDEQDRTNFESWWKIVVHPAPTFGNATLRSAGFLHRCRDAISRYGLGDPLCHDSDIPQCLGPDLLALTSFLYLPDGVATPEFQNAAAFHARLATSYSAGVGTTLLVTSSGHVGMSFNNPNVGDHVVLLAGAKVPLIVRPTVEDKYYLVGPAMVHGLMNGEAWPDEDAGLKRIVLE